MDIRQTIALARQAQAVWRDLPVRKRMQRIRRIRHRIARDAERLAGTVKLPQRTSTAETFSAEVLPLADACRFLEREAPGALAPRRLGARGRPAWLWGVRLEIRAEPLGVVLIIAPWNYPLFLPGVQALQALAAGNAVILKPGRHGSSAAEALAEIFHEAGVDSRLVCVLPESIEAAQAAISAGIDKVVLTGSASTGQAVLAELTRKLTPATMELSGCDAVFVRGDADPNLVARALAFGLRLNGGATCIAPRRVFVHEALFDEVEDRVGALARDIPAVPVDPTTTSTVRALAQEAVAGGARLIAGSLHTDGVTWPLVLSETEPEMRLLQSDIFAPVLSLVRVADDEAALAATGKCPYFLGAAVFGELPGAADLATRIPAGCVVVNDLIVPTADPRLPFGGRGRSGFGVTRGREGLLEMTATKAVAVRRSRWLPHFDPPDPRDSQLMKAYIQFAHAASLGDKLGAGMHLLRVLLSRGKGRRETG
jgi:acyl-CoA reductase-like NAD-dependent aldehyde dehydrogenase